MTNYNSFLNNLLKNPSKKTTISINKINKKIKAMARFTTINYHGDEYIKIIFQDNSFLLILLSEKEIYYSDKTYFKTNKIPDSWIGKKTYINYKEKKYKIANKNDYQFCLQLYVGNPQEIEGECKFSDYFPVDGSKEFLSLGWLTYNDKRADVNPKIIDIKDIEFIS